MNGILNEADRAKRREGEVKSINEKQRELSEKAHRRDRWLFDRLSHIQYELSDEERQKIDKFWSPYGFVYQNEPNTQRIFAEQSGIFDVSYIGYGLHYYLLGNTWWDSTWYAIRDKYYLKSFFPNVGHPHNIIAKSFGCYLADDGRIISEEIAIEKVREFLCSGQGIVIKPSGKTGSGENCFFIENKMEIEDIRQMFSIFSNNFVCQNIVKNHPSYMIQGVKSNNTVRVVTFYWKGKVYLAGALMKFGVEDIHVDNWAKGGIVVRMNEDGVLEGTGVTKRGVHVQQHPKGMLFAGHKCYRGRELQEKAIELHEYIHQCGHIGWDMTVDENGEIILIEANLCADSEMAQAVGVHTFKNEKIAKDVLDDSLFARKATMDWNYREYVDHIVLTKYGGVKHTCVDVPKSIKGKAISEIWNSAFEDQDYKEIHIPCGIKFSEENFRQKNRECILTRY